MGFFDFLTQHSQIVGVALAAVAATLLAKLFNKKKRPVLDPNEYRKFTLREKIPITEGVACPVNLYRFNLPNPTDSLGLPVGQHISLRFVNKENKEVLRSYTPTSSNADLGYFDLVIKVYPNGQMSKYVDSLKPGDSIDVKGPKGRFKYEENKFKKIGMIAGGTGLTPMLQVAREIIERPGDKTAVSFIFANVTESDIIWKDRLDKYASESSKFKIHYTLNEPPSNWTGGVGFVSKEMIVQHLPAPADDIQILMCGPPPMMNAMKKLLAEIGYTDSMIFVF